MRPWIVMSVVLQLALACTFDSTGLESTSAAGPATASIATGETTNETGGDAATQVDPSASESATGGGSASAGETTTPGPKCGDGVIDADEACDGAALGGASCQSLGHAEGDLLCDGQCQYDEQNCSSPGCGDGELDGGEACDCGGGPCTAPQLNNQSCSSLPAPQGGNFSGGELGCVDPGPCIYDTSACTYCGDGTRNAAEVCDGADLGGQTCEGSGFFGGAMACTPECTPDTKGCTNCGNQTLDPGEACDGPQINGKTCKSIDGTKYAGGTPTCTGDCGGFSAEGCDAGDCCQPSDMAGTCSLGLLKACVCVIKGVCCTSAWDSSCVSIAKSLCGAKC